MSRVTLSSKLFGARRSRVAFAATLGVVVAGSLVSPWVWTRPAGGAALASARTVFQAKPDDALARKIEASCNSGDHCTCVEQAVLRLLDLEQAELASRVLGEAETCSTSPIALGLEAEALARLGHADRALIAAANALERSEHQRNGWYAKALVLYRMGKDTEALEAAGRALSAGRGAPAYRLMGALHSRQQDFAAARSDFERALELDSTDIPTRYNLALVSQRQNDYRAAREGYLGVLKRAPEHADSRYNLGVLTHNEGVPDEARHHLRQLAKIVPPNDTRLRKLKALIGAADARAEATQHSANTAPVAQH